MKDDCSNCQVKKHKQVQLLNEKWFQASFWRTWGESRRERTERMGKAEAENGAIQIRRQVEASGFAQGLSTGLSFVTCILICAIRNMFQEFLLIFFNECFAQNNLFSIPAVLFRSLYQAENLSKLRYLFSYYSSKCFFSGSLKTNLRSTSVPWLRTGALE